MRNEETLPGRPALGYTNGYITILRSCVLRINAGQGVGRLGIEPRTRGLKVRCSAS
jgi:hypothetical protein